MTKCEITHYASAAGKAFAFAFYMELERRLGRTENGSVLGLVIAKISSILKRPKQTPDSGKEEPKQ